METSKQNDIKFIFKNIGAIEYAEVPLNDLTMIVGKNSTSKTYLTYIIWGFLDVIHRTLFNYNALIEKTGFFQHDNMISQKIDLQVILSELPSIINDFTKLYKDSKVPEILAIDDLSKLNNFSFEVKLSHNLILDTAIKIADFTVNEILINVSISDNQLSINVIKSSNYLMTESDRRLIADYIFRNLIQQFLTQVFPKPFIITSERTGVGVFRKEIDGYRSGFAETLARDTKIKNISELSREALDNLVGLATNLIARYPAPISENIRLARRLFDYTQKTDFAQPAKEYMTKNLTNGGFVFNKELNEVFYNQEINGNTVSLPYYLISSSVKSHLLLDSYINYIAQAGQILIIDEPELNLHPDNLRHMARLLAMLVNAGVKLLFTTHSDYIIKELNNLIMLESLPDEARDYAIKQIKKETTSEYQSEMFLAKDKVTCIIAEQNAKTHIVRTKEAPINEFGIDADIIDREINYIGETSDILDSLMPRVGE